MPKPRITATPSREWHGITGDSIIRRRQQAGMTRISVITLDDSLEIPEAAAKVLEPGLTYVRFTWRSEMDRYHFPQFEITWIRLPDKDGVPIFELHLDSMNVVGYLNVFLPKDPVERAKRKRGRYYGTYVSKSVLDMGTA